MPSPSVERYECPVHDEPLRFEEDHWECPGGHETAIAIDTAESEWVRYVDDPLGGGVVTRGRFVITPRVSG